MKYSFTSPTNIKEQQSCHNAFDYLRYYHHPISHSFTFSFLFFYRTPLNDKFDVRVTDWYNLNESSPQTPVSPVSSLVSALTTSIGGVTGSKGTSTELSSSGY